MLFSYSPPLSFSERQANMGNYYFNRFISKYPYRKPLPSKKKKNEKNKKLNDRYQQRLKNKKKQIKLTDNIISVSSPSIFIPPCPWRSHVKKYINNTLI